MKMSRRQYKQTYRRFSTFINRILQSKKRPLRILCGTVLNDCRSTTGRNLRKLMVRFDAGNLKELGDHMKKMPEYKIADVNDLWKINAVKDLIEAKFDQTILPYFTPNEIDELCDYLSADVMHSR